jgi:regulatory protein
VTCVVPDRRGKCDEFPALQHYFDLALRALARSDKTRSQIERYLISRSAPPESVATVLQRLEDRGYLNDAAYARRWAERRLAMKPMGRRRMTLELLQHGFTERVAAATIDRVFAEVTETELATRALAQRRSRKTHAQKGRYLHGRGFTGSTIARVLNLEDTED